MFKAFDLWCFNDNSNDWSQKFYLLYKSIADSAKRKEDEQLSKRILNTRPSLQLSAYAGKYSNKQVADISVEINNDALLLKLPNNINLKLAHWHYDLFRGSFSRWWMGNSWVQFSLNEEGKASAVTIDGITYEK